MSLLRKKRNEEEGREVVRVNPGYLQGVVILAQLSYLSSQITEMTKIEQQSTRHGKQTILYASALS